MNRLTRPSRLRRCAAVLAVALVAAAGVSGCGEQRLGSAAVVDGHRITTDQLQQTTRDFEKVVPGKPAATTQVSILQRLILSRVIAKVADKVGVRAQPGKVAAERDSLLKSVGGRKGLIQALAAQQQPTILAPSDVDSWFRDRLLYNEIATKLAGGGNPTSAQNLTKTTRLLSGTATSMKISVNPRYGRWSPRSGITPLVSGGLSKTAAELASA